MSTPCTYSHPCTVCVLLTANRRYLNVSNNELEGALPVLPTGLVSMDISSNQLSGSLPSDMSAYAGLVDIQVRLENAELHCRHHFDDATSCQLLPAW